MELSEAISLIQNEHFSTKNSTEWADLGCGSGLFTFALAQLLQPGSTVFAVDKEPVRLDMRLQPEDIQVLPLQLDFVAEGLPFQHLDGILMGNSLHYVRDKMLLLKRLSSCLKPGGHFLIVEYDTDTPVSHWVPYPVSFKSLKRLFENAEFSSLQKLGERASAFGRANLYAALARQTSARLKNTVGMESF